MGVDHITHEGALLPQRMTMNALGRCFDTMMTETMKREEFTPEMRKWFMQGVRQQAPYTLRYEMNEESDG